jgi:predicted Zn-dependent protease
MFGYAQHTSQSTYIGASTGLRLRHVQPSGYIQVNAKSRDYAQSAWAGAMSTDFTDGEIGVLEAQLTERLQWSRKQVGLPAGRYETLLPPAVVADLMLYTYNSLGARDAQDGRSVFSKPGGTRIGERLAHTPITMRSDPAAVGLECAPFVIAYTSSGMSSVFDNGFPLQPTSWVQDGTLSALVQTRHSAQLTGLPVTPQIDNLIVEGPPGGPSLTGLIESTARGLLLTSIWYIREVDPRTLLLTGLTRDGVFLIEAGEVVGAVNNFRFNESPVDLLGRVSEIGATTRTLAREWGSYFMRTAMPALRVSDFNMSSTSEAS